jgi:hypothetical protein
VEYLQTSGRGESDVATPTRSLCKICQDQLLAFVLGDEIWHRNARKKAGLRDVHTPKPKPKKRKSLSKLPGAGR